MRLSYDLQKTSKDKSQLCSLFPQNAEVNRKGLHFGINNYDCVSERDILDQIVGKLPR